jgi:hypothetical protein
LPNVELTLSRTFSAPGTQVLNSDHTPTFHYTEEQKQKWAEDPESFMKYRQAIEAEYDHGLWGALNRDNQYQHTRRAAMQARMEAKIADPELRKKLIPDFPAGCRRVTPEGELGRCTRYRASC